MISIDLVTIQKFFFHTSHLITKPIAHHYPHRFPNPKIRFESKKKTNARKPSYLNTANRHGTSRRQPTIEIRIDASVQYALLLCIGESHSPPTVGVCFNRVVTQKSNILTTSEGIHSQSRGTLAQMVPA